MKGFGRDFRHAAGRLRKHPGYAALAVLSLGLGIGANTLIFSFVNSLLLRPPGGVPAPNRVLEVWHHNSHAESALQASLPLNYPDYIRYRDYNQAFVELAAFNGDPITASWSQRGEAQIVRGQLVTSNFFEALGVKPAIGRTFPRDQGSTGTRESIIVLSHAFWQTRLGADRGVLSRPLIINGRAFTVVGIAPPDFEGVLIGIRPDFWAPLESTAVLAPGIKLSSRGQLAYFGIGRLKPGVSPEQAQANLAVLAQQIAKEHPEAGRYLSAEVFKADLVPKPFRGYVAGFTGLLLVVVALVLLIACSNAANLLLAQATHRQTELAIRSALGAGRARLVRQFLMESCILAAMSAVVGVSLSSAAVPLLLRLKPSSLPIEIDAPLDWRVLVFTSAIALLTGILFGLFPALKSTRIDLVTQMRGAGYSGAVARSRLRGFLVIVQVAVCVVLLTGAGLCVRSLFIARSIDPGFEVDHRLLVSLNVQIMNYSEDRGRVFYQTLEQHVSAFPGVHAVSMVAIPPLSVGRMTMGVEIEGYNAPSARDEILVGVTRIQPHYFQTLGIPLLRGRDFTDRDNAQAPPVVIINDAMARTYWPGQDPLGKYVQYPGPGPQSSMKRAEVVGVVKTGKYFSLSEAPQPFLYQPFLQAYSPDQNLVVHFTGDAAPVMAAIRAEVRALDPSLAVSQFETLQQHMELPLFAAHTTGLLLGVSGLLALVLAVSGLYGVIAYSASRRTREIGIRMALGARYPDVLCTVMKQGLGLTIVGVGVGLAIALAATRALSALLYGISPFDPVTFVGVALVLILVALAASYIPARRAARMAPLKALRYE